MLFRWAKGFFVTIRGKILLAFLALAAITGLLGAYAVRSVVESGRLVVQTYDRPLMAISYARLAQADFTAMRLALEHRSAAQTEALQHEQDIKLDDLARAVREDLGVAEERSSSSRATDVGATALRAFQSWDQLRRDLTAQGASRDSQAVLHIQAEQVLEALDSLGEVTADDGFRDREAALASIDRYRIVSTVAALSALVLGLLTAIMLARHMVQPIAIASRAASRIAAGELDVNIVPAGQDELGQLLTSMMVMRDNIRAMVEREVAARRSAQSQLVSAIESSHDGVALIDPDHTVLIANSQMAAFFPGCAPDLAAGAPLPAEIEPAMAQPTLEMRLADARWVRLSRSATPNGGWVLIASDITLLKDREDRLRAARDEAQAANRAKTDFLTNMSHELRTPLSAVIGFSEMIVQETFGPVGKPQYRDFAADILHSGRHLLEVITDILDIAKAQSGTIALRLRPVRPQAVMQDAIRIVRNRAEADGVTLDVAMDDALPTLTADAVRLRQVLLNLLSNAIKFTPRGGTVTIRAETLGGGLLITVRDTGIGMAKQDIPRALEPFVQVDTSLNRRYGGTGLGLPLSKLFVELHGGRLTIDSEPGQGTVVRVSLPAADATAQTSNQALPGQVVPLKIAV
ncbi:MAG: ATP-binding protein [Acetobacteraceae bacterium]|nr:ATP-binding protein [Acetobacteraceae bacterium]